jgi:hypothetical protein
MPVKGCFNQPDTVKFFGRRNRAVDDMLQCLPVFLAQSASRTGCIGENQCQEQTLTYFVFEWYTV